ncbi:unnamed protein product [Owenia fusiformis]|uniref:Uncharacterized protein n=1 Tax=Owenia fusiformis TaxID=6347 RepID=A0A8J1TE34_OWEFU|nr:unnamed protein product [Owenia fusiformis]
MGKKKGKKSGAKSTSGKKKGKRGKKTAEPQITAQEAILAYQINIKEKQMEDYMFEIKSLEEKKQRHQGRNNRLKEEQGQYLKTLLKQAREYEKKLDGLDPIQKDAVITIMMDKWESERQEKKNLQELRSEIKKLDSSIEGMKKEVTCWKEYKDRGHQSHKTQITLLEKELIDMNISFEEMSGHLEKTQEKARNEIQEYTDTTLDKQKHLATERAMGTMDKYDRQAVLDNEWIKQEVAIHHKDAKTMVGVVEEMEKENLEIMCDLFECNVDDLKISRNFYLTQFEDNENLDETGNILEIDLSRVSLSHRNETPSPPLVSDVPRKPRPKSAALKAIEEKVAAVTAQHAVEHGYDIDINSDYDNDSIGGDSMQEDPFNNYFNFDDEDFEEYLKLGPLELKLLNVTGNQMTLNKQKTLTEEEIRSKDFRPDEWPVTQPMLQEALGGDKGSPRTPRT